MVNVFQQRGRRSRGEGWLAPTMSFAAYLFLLAPCHTGPHSSMVSTENLLSTAPGLAYTLAHRVGPIRPRKWLSKCGPSVSLLEMQTQTYPIRNSRAQQPVLYLQVIPM